MLHQPEFCFLKTALEKLHLPVHCLTPDRTPEQPLDMGIRRFLGREEEYRHLFQTVPFQMAQNTIYKLSDSFLCNYLFLLRAISLSRRTDTDTTWRLPQPVPSYCIAKKQFTRTVLSKNQRS